MRRMRSRRMSTEEYRLLREIAVQRDRLDAREIAAVILTRDKEQD